MVPESKEGIRTARESLKGHRPNWKDKLRQNCLRRIREERAQLLWRFRFHEQQSANKKEISEYAFRDIVSDELQKIKQSPFGDCQGFSVSKNDDLLWEYDGLHADNSIEIESEEMLIEMERLLYEELRQETIQKELEFYEEEDEYLAQAVFEHMQLDNNQACTNEKIWCPMCKQGELREAYHLIYCMGCNLQLDLENDKVNLNFLRNRLGEVHVEHLEKGCKATPRFCMEAVFDLTAMYIQCQACGTFEIVI